MSETGAQSAARDQDSRYIGWSRTESLLHHWKKEVVWFSNKRKAFDQNSPNYL